MKQKEEVKGGSEQDSSEQVVLIAEEEIRNKKEFLRILKRLGPDQDFWDDTEKMELLLKVLDGFKFCKLVECTYSLGLTLGMGDRGICLWDNKDAVQLLLKFNEKLGAIELYGIDNFATFIPDDLEFLGKNIDLLLDLSWKFKAKSMYDVTSLASSIKSKQDFWSNTKNTDLILELSQPLNRVRVDDAIVFAKSIENSYWSDKETVGLLFDIINNAFQGRVYDGARSVVQLMGVIAHNKGFFSNNKSALIERLSALNLDMDDNGVGAFIYFIIEHWNNQGLITQFAELFNKFVIYNRHTSTAYEFIKHVATNQEFWGNEKNVKLLESIYKQSEGSIYDITDLVKSMKKNLEFWSKNENIMFLTSVSKQIDIHFMELAQSMMDNPEFWGDMNNMTFLTSIYAQLDRRVSSTNFVKSVIDNPAFWGDKKNVNLLISISKELGKHVSNTDLIKSMIEYPDFWRDKEHVELMRSVYRLLQDKLDKGSICIEFVGSMVQNLQFWSKTEKIELLFDISYQLGLRYSDDIKQLVDHIDNHKDFFSDEKNTALLAKLFNSFKKPEYNYHHNYENAISRFIQSVIDILINEVLISQFKVVSEQFKIEGIGGAAWLIGSFVKDKKFWDNKELVGLLASLYKKLHINFAKFTEFAELTIRNQEFLDKKPLTDMLIAYGRADSRKFIDSISHYEKVWLSVSNIITKSPAMKDGMSEIIDLINWFGENDIRIAIDNFAKACIVFGNHKYLSILGTIYNEFRHNKYHFAMYQSSPKIYRNWICKIEVLSQLPLDKFKLAFEVIASYGKGFSGGLLPKFFTIIQDINLDILDKVSNLHQDFLSGGKFSIDNFEAYIKLAENDDIAKRFFPILDGVKAGMGGHAHGTLVGMQCICYKNYIDSYPIGDIMLWSFIHGSNKKGDWYLFPFKEEPSNMWLENGFKSLGICNNLSYRGTSLGKSLTTVYNAYLFGFLGYDELLRIRKTFKLSEPSKICENEKLLDCVENSCLKVIQNNELIAQSDMGYFCDAGQAYMKSSYNEH